ncbi:MAG: glucokinase [Gemmatimonadota bacterium]|nr:glucokinase [Gemmatimonadota bacterium]
MRVLAGDVGGTHVRLAIVEVDADHWRIIRMQRSPSARHDGLVPFLRDFLDAPAPPPARACIGIAGPVMDGASTLSNLGWHIEARAVERAMGMATTLLNDFVALGHAIPRLTADDVVEIQRGRPVAGAPIAVIGPGTGLGQGFLLRDRDRWGSYASEGGHADFAPQTPLERDLADALEERFGHVSFERVVSGPGLVNVYEFLAAREPTAVRPDTRRAMADGDPAAAISARALDGADELCVRALDLFVSVFGAQAGNFALTIQARGGVHITGGIAPQILPKLTDGRFLTAFRDKGRFAGFMADVPVRVVTNPDAGLLGAAVAAWGHPGR